MRTTIIIASILFIGLGINAQTYSLSGTVSNANGDPLCGVDMKLVSDNGTVWDTSSDEEGNYQFDNIPNDNYTLQGSIDDSPLNGVSTFDLVQTSRHILGFNLLPPAVILGADVNGTGSVTTLDLIFTRMIILNIDQEFPVPSWRVYVSTNGWPIPGNYQFTGLETEIVINGLQEDLTDLDFFGVKTGDTNGSAATNTCF